MDIPQFSGRYCRVYPPESFLGRAEKGLELEKTTTAFLIVDAYSHSFSRDDPRPQDYPSMSLAASVEKEREILVEHIRPALDAARRAGLPTIYLTNSAPPIAIGRSELGKIARRCDDLDWEEWGSEDNVDPREYVYGNSAALGF